MLSMEYLVEEAKALGLPVQKKRAILREYLQNMLLSGLYRSREGKKLYFMGGTALRFCHRLPRFSEDLDFNAYKLDYDEFKKIVTKSTEPVKKEGVEAKTTYSLRKGIFTAEIDFPAVMEQYNIYDNRGLGLRVKFELNQPTWPLETENTPIFLYGFNYIATRMSDRALITEKLCALLGRNRGRDIYDLLFLMRKKIPFDERILKAYGHQTPPKELILKHLEKLSRKDLENLSLQVKPFLFKEEDSFLISNALEYAEKLLEEYL